ncbi:Calponin-3 [Thoreauomyces humboldtii]|nr:Calponin-3 [Thoreauomyces humboldtii]
MMGQLKGRISRTQSSESIPAPVTSVEDGDEKDIRKWIFETLGEKDPSGELALVLKDGQILCRLMNTLRPATPIKINTGKFKFAAIENVNAYLRQAEQAFATPRMFEPAELQDGDCQRELVLLQVLEHLAAIEKKNKA